MAGEFDKYWDCPKKHTKRTMHWLPRAKEIKDEVDDRAFRYLTLCARSMIDVFMLVRANILTHDANAGTIDDVVFCERDAEDHAEITTILGNPGSGFGSKLEDLILFNETQATLQFPGVNEIDLFFQTKREDRNHALREKLKLKKEHLLLLEKFPFDFINLDFCGYYYPPPDILEINTTVRKVLELQSRQGLNEHGQQTSVEKFLLSVTCRLDDGIPQKAWHRLEQIVKDNIKNWGDYNDALINSHKPTDLKSWRTKDPLDFFLSAWPKEMLSFAREFGWKMEIKDVVHYWRGAGRRRFRIICLVAEFERSAEDAFYLTQSIQALDSDLRTFIGSIDPKAREARKLHADLSELRDMRNDRAAKMGITEGLPSPVFR